MSDGLTTPAGGAGWAVRIAVWRDGRGPWWAWSAISISSFMVLLDTAIINVARPAMASGLHIGLEETVWVSTAYLLAFAVPLLLAARLGDRLGAKRVFLAGLGIFTAASACCGLAPAGGVLIVARAIQGLGAAAMTPQTMPVLNRLFLPGRRGTPLGLVSTIGGLANVASPLLGGSLVQTLGWRAIFFVNVPIGVLALCLTALLVPDIEPVHHRRFDVVGVVLSCTGLGLIVYGIQEGPRYLWGAVRGPITIPYILGAGVVLLVAFVAYQRLVPDPILDLRLFGHRNFTLANIAYLSIGFVMPALWIPLLIYLQSVLGLSALHAGLLSAPVSAMSAIVAPLAGRLSDHLDGRRVTLAGFIIFGAGMAAIALLARRDTSPVSLIPELVLIGIGTGALFAPLTNLAFADLPDHFTGAGSGVFSSTSQIGGMFGAAMVGALIAAQVPGKGSIALARALTDSTRDTLQIGVATLAIGIFACLTMRSQPRSTGPSPDGGDEPGSS